MSYKNDLKETTHATTILGFSIWVFAIVVLPLIVGIGYLSYLSYYFYASKYEQVRYDVFKQSQTYNEGMLRDLQDLRLEYIKANAEQKAALKAIILHRFSVYDFERLPYDLRVFYNDLKNS